MPFEEQNPTTYFSTTVDVLISAENEPSVILEELQYALNEAFYKLESRLSNRSINFKLEDTWSEVV